MMDLEKKDMESYLKNEVEPVFPVIFKMVHCKETIISKSEKDVLHNKLIPLKLKRYYPLLKYKSTLYKPICSNNGK